MNTTRLLYLVLVVVVFAGCGAVPQRMTAPAAYSSVAAANYPCPYCGYLMYDNALNHDIRQGNNCARCGKMFFYTPPVSQEQEPENYQYGKRRNYGPTNSGWSHTRHRSLDTGGYRFGETPNGYWDFYWDFRDYDTHTDYSYPYWTTRSYRLFR